MAGLEYPACVTYEVALQRGGFVPLADESQLMAEAGQGEARQLVSLNTEQAVAFAVSHLLNQAMMQFSHRMQVTLVVTIQLADLCHILTGIVELTQLMYRAVGPIKLCLRHVKVDGDIADAELVFIDFVLEPG